MTELALVQPAHRARPVRIAATALPPPAVHSCDHGAGGEATRPCRFRTASRAVRNNDQRTISFARLRSPDGPPLDPERRCLADLQTKRDALLLPFSRANGSAAMSSSEDGDNSVGAPATSFQRLGAQGFLKAAGGALSVSLLLLCSALIALAKRDEGNTERRASFDRLDWTRPLNDVHSTTVPMNHTNDTATGQRRRRNKRMRSEVDFNSAARSRHLSAFDSDTHNQRSRQLSHTPVCKACSRQGTRRAIALHRLHSNRSSVGAPQ